jgi:hypothetical protein
MSRTPFDLERLLGATIRAPREAREFVAGAVVGVLGAGVAPDLNLVASELVVDRLRCCPAPQDRTIRLGVSRYDGCVRVEAEVVGAPPSDAANTAPEPGERFGPRLVAGASRRSGYLSPRGGRGTVVWAELAV